KRRRATDPRLREHAPRRREDGMHELALFAPRSARRTDTLRLRSSHRRVRTRHASSRRTSEWTQGSGGGRHVRDRKGPVSATRAKRLLALSAFALANAAPPASARAAEGAEAFDPSRPARFVLEPALVSSRVVEQGTLPKNAVVAFRLRVASSISHPPVAT